MVDDKRLVKGWLYRRPSYCQCILAVLQSGRHKYTKIPRRIVKQPSVRMSLDAKISRSHGQAWGRRLPFPTRQASGFDAIKGKGQNSADNGAENSETVD